MSKIVYLIEQPLDGRNHERFGIQTWIAKGWTVEVWDLTPCAQPHVWQNFRESGCELSECEGYLPITSRRELDYRCSKLEKLEYFIDLAGNSYYSMLARLRLMRAGATRVICSIGSTPDADADPKRGFAGRLIKAFSKRPIKSFKWLGSLLVSRLAAPFVRPGLSVVSGEKSLRSSLETGCNHKILKAHNLDYDIYLKLRESTGVPTKGYGVFLDQNICFAPDYIYENVPCYATADKYFSAIRDGLSRISHVLQVSMRIAAHPRLPRKTEFLDYFQGMSTEYGKTAELIASCGFVVCHYSTAIQLAVLFNKPIIFVTTDQLTCSPAEKHIARFAAALGKSVINLDGDLAGVDWQQELRIDSQKYDEYRREYIKTDGSPDIPYWDLVVDHIEKGRGRHNVPSARRAYAGGSR
jgi:hypothetical protein